MSILLADIGGTNIRFTLLHAGEVTPAPPERFRLDGFPGIAEAIEGWLATQPGPRPRGAVLAVAGPVAGNRAVLTNRGWPVDALALGTALGFGTVRVVNDFEALAWSLPLLGGDDLFPLGGAFPGEGGAPIAVLGPGTGLGVACFLPGPPEQVLPTEGGHVALAAGTAAEARAIEAMREGFGGHVSRERGALSGQGIENLHAALGGDPALRAPAITAAGIAGTDPRCAEALAMFCALLGAAAGDVALHFGARGGVLIGGGICPRFPEFLAASAFRARFEAKGRFRDWLAPVPAAVIVRPDAAMLGLAALARRM